MAGVMEDPKAWDNVSTGYNNLITGAFREFNEQLVSPLPNAGRCLDLCCGSGAASLALSKKFDRVDAIDFSNGMLKQLEHNARAENISNIHIQQADALKIHEIFEPETFDFIWSSFGVFMIPSYRDVFERALQLLKPGGTFLFTGFPKHQESPFHKALFESCKAAKDDFPLPDYKKEGLHDPNFVEQVLGLVGFEKAMVELKSVPFQVSDVESFWRDLEIANVQFGPLRNSLGENGWDNFSENAKKFLKSNYSFPSSLNMVAMISRGEKPGRN